MWLQSDPWGAVYPHYRFHCTIKNGIYFSPKERCGTGIMGHFTDQDWCMLAGAMCEGCRPVIARRLSMDEGALKGAIENSVRPLSEHSSNIQTLASWTQLLSV